VVNYFDVDVDLGRVIAKLDLLEEDVTANAPRPVAQAGAQVFYEEVKARAPVSEKGHWFHGTSFKKTGQKYWFERGTLRDAIYQAFSEDNSGDGVATYHIAWNHQKAPYGFMVEFGTSRAPSNAFLRPGFYAAQSRALEAARLEAERRIGPMIQEFEA